jgi:hypothetical protein
MARGDRLGLGLFRDDRAAQRYALIANTHSTRASDQALNFFLTSAAE